MHYAWLGDLRGKRILGLAAGGGQLAAGFRLLDIYSDTNNKGPLAEHNVPSFFATKPLKE